MDKLFRLKLKVRDYEVDSQGIVNNAVYLHYMEHTRHEFCDAVGTSFRDLQSRGLDPVVRRLEIDYLRPLTLGQEMESRLSMRREGARFVFEQDIVHYPSMEPAARARVTIVCLRDGRMDRGDALAREFADYLNTHDTD